MAKEKQLYYIVALAYTNEDKIAFEHKDPGYHSHRVYQDNLNDKVGISKSY